MPTIAQFYGISLRMYAKDHPPPHFHAVYNGLEATFAITDLAVMEGRLPRRAIRMVLEWAALNRSALERNWQLAAIGEPLEKIGGLDADTSD